MKFFENFKIFVGIYLVIIIVFVLINKFYNFILDVVKRVNMSKMFDLENNFKDKCNYILDLCKILI